MSEHPKKRKRKTSYPSRYSGSSAINRHIENNGIFFDHCYSVCSSMQNDPKASESDDEPSSNGPGEELCDSITFDNPLSPEMMPAEVTIGEDEDVASPIQDEDEENPVVEDEEDQPSPNSSCENVVEKSQASNITLPQKWPLLRANNCGMFKCEQCDFNSKYFSDLKQHMILKHKCEESNVCKVCKQSFPTDDLLLEHSKVHEEDPYSCKYCDFKTSVFENLSQHVADVHFNDFLYWCEQCDLQFCTSSELYLHFQEHSCDEQYLCQFCEHETNDPEDLHSHVVNEHACKLIELSDTYNSENGQFSLLNKISFDKSNNFFVCQVCGFRSRLHTNVNRHVAIEHTRFFPHVCDDCGKGFSGMLEYTKHLNLHLSEGVFLCQYCEYSTGQLEDLKTHLDFRHATNLPYKCSDCMLRFGSDDELKSHLQVHDKP